MTLFAAGSLVPAHALAQSTEKLPPIDPSVNVEDKAAASDQAPSPPVTQATPPSTQADTSVGLPPSSPNQAKSFGGPEAVMFPAILVVGLLLGGGVGWWWYRNFLETTLSSDTIHSPSSHAATSIGVMLSVTALIAGVFASGVLPFVAFLAALGGVVLWNFGSRHTPALIVAIVAGLLCVFRGTFNIMSAS
jgi:hypothetical protein